MVCALALKLSNTLSKDREPNQQNDSTHHPKRANTPLTKMVRFIHTFIAAYVLVHCNMLWRSLLGPKSTMTNSFSKYGDGGFKTAGAVYISKSSLVIVLLVLQVTYSHRAHTIIALYEYRPAKTERLVLFPLLLLLSVSWCRPTFGIGSLLFIVCARDEHAHSRRTQPRDVGVRCWCRWLVD